MNKYPKDLFIGILFLEFALAIPYPAWAPWVPIEGQHGPGPDPIKNTEGATDLAFCLDSSDFPRDKKDIFGN